MTERVWIIVSGVLLLVAAGWVWRNNYSAAFVTAILGACAWFLSYRAQLKAKISDEDTSYEHDDEQPDED
jgi:hypothetical protein